jgi:hypothetical protein
MNVVQLAVLLSFDEVDLPMPFGSLRDARLPSAVLLQLS